MGQGKSIYPKQQVTPEKLQESISLIFDSTETKVTATDVAVPLRRILSNLAEFIPNTKTQQGFLMNPVMVQIFFHGSYLSSMEKLINLLVEKLEQMLTRTAVLISKDEWAFCLDLANFIVFFTDDKTINMVQTATVRSDLHPQTDKLFKSLQDSRNQFTASENLIKKLSMDEIERIDKCLRVSLTTMINMHLQVLSRGKDILVVVARLQQACFMLYLKVLYSPQQSHKLLAKGKKQYLKANLNIAQYFLGKGLNENKSSIFESSVLLLTSLIESNLNFLRQFKALPSHLFKNLPIICQTTVYDFIICILLFSLTYVKEGTNSYSRMQFNRIMTLKLIDLCMKQIRMTSPQITYYLQQVCLQTKIGQIERSFVTGISKSYNQLIDNYSKLQVGKNEKTNILSLQKASSTIKPQPQQDSQERQKRILKRFLRESKRSQIIDKYLSSGTESYNVKYSNKKFKISTIDIVTELQNDQTTIQGEFKSLCQKYIYEIMLGKKFILQYNDRQLWNEILPGILQERCSIDSQQRDRRYEGDGHNNKMMTMMRQQEDQEYDDNKQQLQQVVKKSSSQNNQNVIVNNVVVEPIATNSVQIKHRQQTEQEEKVKENEEENEEEENIQQKVVNDGDDDSDEISQEQK